MIAAADWSARLLALGLPAPLPDFPLLRAIERGIPPAAEQLAAALARLDPELSFAGGCRLEESTVPARCAGAGALG